MIPLIYLCHLNDHYHILNYEHYNPPVINNFNKSFVNGLGLDKILTDITLMLELLFRSIKGIFSLINLHTTSNNSTTCVIFPSNYISPKLKFFSRFIIS